MPLPPDAQPYGTEDCGNRQEQTAAARPARRIDFNDQPTGRLTLIRDLLDRLPDTKMKEATIDWKPLGHKPLKEQFGVLGPIPDYPLA